MQNVMKTLPDNPEDRKSMPITTGVLDYFPLALAEVAKVSKAGNDQHNPGQPLHWNRGKSSDHADCVTRHLIQRGSKDSDGQRHSAKLAWRALAILQEELEKEAGFIPSGTLNINPSMESVYILASTDPQSDTWVYKWGCVCKCCIAHSMRNTL